MRNLGSLVKRLLLASSIFGSGMAGFAQLGQPIRPSAVQTQAATASSTETASIDVTGTVVNARSRSPIARALVHLGSRVVLTDHDGIFTFPQVNSTSVSFTANKPGFYATPDGDGVQPRSYHLPLTSPVELTLYPEAILSGSIANQRGDGVNGLNVTAQRSVFDENGHHWYPAGQAQTSSRGEFRIAVPSGHYMLRVVQRGHSYGGTEVVLPLQVPAGTSSNKEAIRLLPGEEARFDLRAEVRRAYTVNFHMDMEGRGFPSLVAKSANGAQMPLSVTPSREQGELRVSLPAGTYTILGSVQNQEGQAQGQTQVTVADHDVSGIELRFTRAASLPVEVEADSSAIVDANAKLPDANQLGLTLQATREGPDENGTGLRVTNRKNLLPAFAVADGVYRLHAQAGGQWYVTTAVCGGVDLLAQEIPISAGLDGTEVRVRVSNNTATVSGKVTVSGGAGAAWIYLLATHPSATPVIILRSNTDGSFFRPYLAPGGYRVIALEQKINADLQDNATLSRYLDRVQALTLNPGEQHTMTLDAVTERESSQ